MSAATTNKVVGSNDDEGLQQTPAAGIQVICAGLGRTGTMSLTEALNLLGYKSYHYLDLTHHQLWADYVNSCSGGEQQQQKQSMDKTTGPTKDSPTTIDDVIDRLVADGYTATLENPTSDIYQELLRRYPKAKVILTVRDTPQAFVKSWKLLFDTMVVTETTFSWTFPSFLGYIPLFRNLKQIRQFMGTTHLGLPPGALTHTWRDLPTEEEADAFLTEQYNRHNQHVIDHVRTATTSSPNSGDDGDDQLLIFNVKDGWEPLCKFLGKEVPANNIPFPHVQTNNAESLKQLRKTFVWIVYGWIPVLVLTTAIGVGAAAWGMKGLGGGGRGGSSRSSSTVTSS